MSIGDIVEGVFHVVLERAPRMVRVLLAVNQRFRARCNHLRAVAWRWSQWISLFPGENTPARP